MKMYGYITNDKKAFIASARPGQARSDLCQIIQSIEHCDVAEAHRKIKDNYKELELEYTEVS